MNYFLVKDYPLDEGCVSQRFAWFLLNFHVVDIDLVPVGGFFGNLENRVHGEFCHGLLVFGEYLLAKDTSATFRSNALSFGSILIAIWLRTSRALLEASRYPSTITVGWIPWSRSSSAFFSSSPATTTEVVVPSPTSSSWVLATSTIILAAGCCTSISSSIVAPSLVMVTSPNPSTSILSIPLGPNEDRTDSAIIFAAMIFALSASWPLLLEVPSLRIITC